MNDNMVPVYCFKTSGQYETRHRRKTKKYMEKLSKETGILGVTPVVNSSLAEVVYYFETKEEAESARKLTEEYGFPVSEVRRAEIPIEYVYAKNGRENR